MTPTPEEKAAREAWDKAWREPWTLYFEGGPPGLTPCRRHGFVDTDGGLCPSCVSYVLTSYELALNKAHDESRAKAVPNEAGRLPHEKETDAHGYSHCAHCRLDWDLLDDVMRYDAECPARLRARADAMKRERDVYRDLARLRAHKGEAVTAELAKLGNEDHSWMSRGNLLSHYLTAAANWSLTLDDLDEARADLARVKGERDAWEDAAMGRKIDLQNVDATMHAIRAACRGEAWVTSGVDPVLDAVLALREIRRYLEAAAKPGPVDVSAEWGALADEDRERLQTWGDRVCQAGIDSGDDAVAELEQERDTLTASLTRLRDQLSEAHEALQQRNDECIGLLALSGEQADEIARLREEKGRVKGAEAALLNERGEGEGPSPGWTFNRDFRRWEKAFAPDDAAYVWIRSAFNTSLTCPWHRFRPGETSRGAGSADTARDAMKAADALSTPDADTETTG